MKVNTKIRYGLRTLIEIALQDQEKGILQKDISKNQNLSEKYLDQIIAALKKHKLIKNIGGKKSGYILAKPDKEIRIIDIFLAFDSSPAIVSCIDDKDDNCEKRCICAAQELWTGLNNTIIEYLKNATLDTLLTRSKEFSENISNTITQIS